MKTKTNCSLIVAIGLFTAATVCAQTNDSVDFTKTNPLLQALTLQVLAGENQVTYAYPEFDTKLSNVQSERLVYGMKGKVQNTNWGSDANIVASTEYQIDRSPQESGIAVRFQGKIQSDTLKMFHYLSTEVLQKASGFTYNSPARVAILKRAIQTQTISELNDVLQDALQQTLSDIDSEIAKTTSEQECLIELACGNPTIDAWGNRAPDEIALLGNKLMVEQLRRMRMSFSSTTFAYDKNSNTIAITAAAPQGFFARVGYSFYGAETRSFSGSIAANQLTVKGSLFVPTRIDSLDQLHKQMVQDLSGLNANDPASVARIQNGFKRALMQFKRVINAEILH